MTDKGTSEETPQEAEITCRQFTDFLSDYFDEVLPAARREVFDAHVQRCDDCAAYLSSLRETIRLTRLCGAEEHNPHDVSEELVQAVVAAIKGKKGEGHSR